MVTALTNEEAWTLKQIDRNVDAIIRWIEKVDRLIPILMEQKSLAEKQATSNWISVEERLPKIYQTVLVYRENISAHGGYMTLEYIVPDFGKPTQWKNDLNTWKSKVTHWMPLPEPPEVEL